MGNTARSITVFGIYLTLTGLALVIIPNIILPLLGLGTTTEIWIRVVGLLTLILGGYFLNSVRTNDDSFYRATIYARLVFFTGIAVFVLSGLASPLLVLFGLIDLAGAAWTWTSLRGGNTGRA
jgi:hypothetical protein